VAAPAGSPDASPKAIDQTTTLVRRTSIARALFGMGGLAVFQGDYGTARRVLEESRGMWSELGDEHSLAYVLTFLGFAALGQDDVSAALRFAEESSALFRRLGDPWGLALSLTGMGNA